MKRTFPVVVPARRVHPGDRRARRSLRGRARADEPAEQVGDGDADGDAEYELHRASVVPPAGDAEGDHRRRVTDDERMGPRRCPDRRETAAQLRDDLQDRDRWAERVRREGDVDASRVQCPGQECVGGAVAALPVAAVDIDDQWAALSAAEVQVVALSLARTVRLIEQCPGGLPKGVRVRLPAGADAVEDISDACVTMAVPPWDTAAFQRACTSARYVPLPRVRRAAWRPR